MFYLHKSLCQFSSKVQSCLFYHEGRTVNFIMGEELSRMKFTSTFVFCSPLSLPVLNLENIMIGGFGDLTLSYL